MLYGHNSHGCCCQTVYAYCDYSAALRKGNSDAVIHNFIKYHLPIIRFRRLSIIISLPYYFLMAKAQREKEKWLKQVLSGTLNISLYGILYMLPHILNYPVSLLSPFSSIFSGVFGFQILISFLQFPEPNYYPQKKQFLVQFYVMQFLLKEVCS